MKTSSTAYAAPALPAPRSCAKIGIDDCIDAPTKNDPNPARAIMLTIV